MRLPHTPHSTRPCSSAGPSRGGVVPWSRESASYSIQVPLVLLEVLPRDVARVQVAQEHRPFAASELARRAAPAAELALARATECIRPGVARVVQHLERAACRSARSTPDRPCADRAVGGTGSARPARRAFGPPPLLNRCAETSRKRSHRVLHLAIRVELYLAGGIVHEAYRQPELQLTSARFGHVAAEHPSAQARATRPRSWCP